MRGQDRAARAETTSCVLGTPFAREPVARGLGGSSLAPSSRPARHTLCVHSAHSSREFAYITPAALPSFPRTGEVPAALGSGSPPWPTATLLGCLSALLSMAEQSPRLGAFLSGQREGSCVAAAGAEVALNVPVHSWIELLEAAHPGELHSGVGAGRLSPALEAAACIEMPRAEQTWALSWASSSLPTERMLTQLVK